MYMTQWQMMDIKQSMMAMEKYSINLVILDSSPYLSISSFTFVKIESESIVIIAYKIEIWIFANPKKVLQKGSRVLLVPLL